MVRWTLPARSDLHEIYAFIAQDSVFYASKVTDEIIDKTAMLETFPMAGRKRVDLGGECTRELLVYSYRVIYETAEDGVRILAVVHGKRNLREDTLRASQERDEV